MVGFCLWENDKVSYFIKSPKQHLKVNGIEYSYEYLDSLPLEDRTDLGVYNFQEVGTNTRDTLFTVTYVDTKSGDTVTRTYTQTLKDVTHLKASYADRATAAYLSQINELHEQLDKYPITVDEQKKLQHMVTAVQGHKATLDTKISGAADEADFVEVKTLLVSWPKIEDYAPSLDQAKDVRKSLVDKHRLSVTGDTYTHDFGGAIGTKDFQLRNDRDMINIMMTTMEAMYQAVKGNGDTENVNFRMDDNTTVTVSCDEFLTATSAMYNDLHPVFVTAWNHKNAIDAINTTVEDVEDYDYTTGWS